MLIQKLRLFSQTNPGRESRSVRTAIANTVVNTVVFQQYTWICSPNSPYLLAFNASWGKKNIWKEYNWPLKVKNRGGPWSLRKENRDASTCAFWDVQVPVAVPGALNISVWTMSFPFASELAEGAGRSQTAQEQSGHVLNLAFHTSPPATCYSAFYS